MGSWSHDSFSYLPELNYQKKRRWISRFMIPFICVIIFILLSLLLLFDLWRYFVVIFSSFSFHRPLIILFHNSFCRPCKNSNSTAKRQTPIVTAHRDEQRQPQTRSSGINYWNFILFSGCYFSGEREFPVYLTALSPSLPIALPSWDWKAA